MDKNKRFFVFEVSDKFNNLNFDSDVIENSTLVYCLNELHSFVILDTKENLRYEYTEDSKNVLDSTYEYPCMSISYEDLKNMLMSENPRELYKDMWNGKVPQNFDYKGLLKKLMKLKAIDMNVLLDNDISHSETTALLNLKEEKENKWL